MQPEKPQITQMNADLGTWIQSFSQLQKPPLKTRLWCGRPGRTVQAGRLHHKGPEAGCLKAMLGAPLSRRAS